MKWDSDADAQLMQPVRSEEEFNLKKYPMMAFARHQREIRDEVRNRVCGEEEYKQSIVERRATTQLKIQDSKDNWNESAMYEEFQAMCLSVFDHAEMNNPNGFDFKVEKMLLGYDASPEFIDSFLEVLLVSNSELKRMIKELEPKNQLIELRTTAAHDECKSLSIQAHKIMSTPSSLSSPRWPQSPFQSFADYPPIGNSFSSRASSSIGRTSSINGQDISCVFDMLTLIENHMKKDDRQTLPTIQSDTSSEAKEADGCDEDVVITGQKSWEQRDNELREKAISVE